MNRDAGNWYNEIDPLKAEVLREAMKAGAIAPGDVDERSIADVRPGELVGYTQCHFFAGGGFWSLALRWAGWPDDRPVWTGSCPCPSFSAAGKGGGFDDPRHLWPHWAELIRECKPAVVFGEQADDAVGYGWLDLVQTDLEAASYAVGKIVFGACSVGAPHIRQRLYFCADAEQVGRQHLTVQRPTRVFAEAHGAGGEQFQSGDYGPGSFSSPDAMHPERRALDIDGGDGCDRQDCGRPEARSVTGAHGEVLRGRHAEQPRLQERELQPGVPGGADGPPAGKEPQRRSCACGRCDANMPCAARHRPNGGASSPESGLRGGPSDSGEPIREWRGPGWLDPRQARSVAEAGATRGFWADCDWWYGRDGKYRPIGPGLFPLAHGSPARVGRLRLYGDGIVVPAAAAFIKAYLEARSDA